MTQLLRQIGSFGFVGISATFTHLIIAYALIEGTSANAYVANGIGALCAFWVSFLGNTRMTFLYRGSIRSALLRYTMLTLVSFTITTAILYITRSFNLPIHLYVLASLAAIPPITFTLSKYWVFRSGKTFGEMDSE
jgi:putative flippase GtrA